MIEQVGSDTVIVGTAHISAKSVQEVEDTIRERKPQKVLVELDPKRYDALRDPEAWKKTDIIQILREKRQHVFLLQLYLANMQARMGQETGVPPGGELVKAIEVAEDVGAEVVLIDRDVGVTLKRGFGAMSLRQRMGLFMNVLMEALPGEEPADRPEPDLRRKTMTGFGVTALLTMLMAFTSAGAWLQDRVDGLLDALVGYTTFPVASFGALGVLLGGLLTAAMPRDAPEDGQGPWAWLHTIPVPAFTLGLTAAWTWGFRGPLSTSFLSVPGAGLAIAFVVGGTWFGHASVHAIRTFQRQRASIGTRGEMDIDAMLEQDAITAMTDEFAQFAPSIKTALIDERDDYMAAHIREQSKDHSVVAVVGAGHVAGIKDHMGWDVEDRRDELDQVPRRFITFGKAIGVLLPLFILGAFAWMAATGDFQELKQSLIYWVLVNGSLSALGALLARGHILSIIVAFVAAPLTSLSPALAAGWFAGLTEAKMHTPNVGDFEEIKTLETWKDFWKNGVVRILLVTALANLGSVAGSWLGLIEVAKSLGGVP